MSQPNGLMEHDLQLVDYLLGLLPEKESDQLDEASIVDDEMAARLCSVENDLVDAYVLGALDQNIRDHFEATYLNSPRRRAKVNFARRFLTVVDRASTPNTPPAAAAVTRPDRVRRFPALQEISKPSSTVHRSRVRWPLLTAAASFLLACGLLVSDDRWRAGLNQGQRRSAAQDRRVDVRTPQIDDSRRQDPQIAAPGRAPVASEPLSASEPTPRAPATAVKPTVLFPQTRS